MDNESSNKRQRGPNFTKEEQLVLFSALEAYTNVIECKKTDQIKQSQKQNAWVKITEIYNANTKGISRNTENLQACYRNTKSKLKKQQSGTKMQLPDPAKQEALISALEDNGKDWDSISDTMNTTVEACQSTFQELQKAVKREEVKRKRKSMSTGGGPPSPDNDNCEDPLVKFKKFIEPQMDGMYTIYDADALLMEQFQKTQPLKEQKLPIEINFLDCNKENQGTSIINNAETPINKSDNLPNTRIDVLKKKKAPELDIDKDTPNPNRNKKITVNDNFMTLSNAKLELVRLQKQQIELDLKHRERMNELEYEDKIKANQFNEECRRKELYLLDLKIKNIQN